MTAAAPPIATPGDYTGVDFATHVILQSSDGPEFAVPRKAAEMSVLMKNMMEESEPGDQIVIPIPNVNSRVLSYVVEYIMYHQDNRSVDVPKPLKKPIKDVISEWDYAFIFGDLVKGGNEKEHSLLIECLLAANFLDLKDLLDLTAVTLASLMRGKTPDEIRETFNIKNDFTEAEEAKFKDGITWVED